MLKKYQQITNSVVRFVNSFTQANRKTLDVFVPRKMRATLFELGEQCVKLGLVVGPLGQFSMRLSADRLLITASGASFSRIRDQDLIVTSYAGEKLMAKEASIQNLDWHRAIYQNEEAEAVLFCQPAAALTVASKPVEINPMWMHDAPGVTGQIGFAAQDHEDIRDLAANHQVILIEGKGMLSWGGSLEEAVDRAQVAERWCQIALNMSLLKKGLL